MDAVLFWLPGMQRLQKAQFLYFFSFMQIS